MGKIIAARQDGLCSRLGAILNAMYLAKKNTKRFLLFLARFRRANEKMGRN